MIVRWATDVYVFNENQITATVELVTDSTFEVAQFSIQGFPRQIPDGNPNRIDSLVVPGPAFPGTYLIEVKQLLCTFHIRHFINIFSFQMFTNLCCDSSFLLYIGFAFSATIERVFVTVPNRLFGDRIFGNAQLTGKILRIDVMKEPKLICCTHLSMQSLVAVML